MRPGLESGPPPYVQGSPSPPASSFCCREELLGLLREPGYFLPHVFQGRRRKQCGLQAPSPSGSLPLICAGTGLGSLLSHLIPPGPPPPPAQKVVLLLFSTQILSCPICRKLSPSLCGSSSSLQVVLNLLGLSESKWGSFQPQLSRAEPGGPNRSAVGNAGCQVVSLLSPGHRPLTLAEAQVLGGQPCAFGATRNHTHFQPPVWPHPRHWLHGVSSDVHLLKISVTFPSQAPHPTEAAAFPFRLWKLTNSSQKIEPCAPVKVGFVLRGSRCHHTKGLISRCLLPGGGH